MDKKTRTPNFTITEKVLVVELLRKYMHIIECKKTDTQSNKTKLAAWVQVAEEFNSYSNTYRNFKTSKSKYENLKMITNKKIAEEKCFVRGTGGGPSKVFKVSEVEEQLRCLLTSRLTGMPSIR